VINHHRVPTSIVIIIIITTTTTTTIIIVIMIIEIIMMYIDSVILAGTKIARNNKMQMQALRSFTNISEDIKC